MAQSIESSLRSKSIKPSLTCRLHEASLTREDHPVDWSGDTNWQVSKEFKSLSEIPLQGEEWIINLRRQGDALENASISLDFDFGNWSKDSYVFMPAAAYAGNRFESRKIKYPPILDESEHLTMDAAPIISDVPRLKLDGKNSELVQMTRDCTTPMIGIWDPVHKTAFFLVMPHATRFGDSGLEVVDGPDFQTATVRLRVPGIRPGKRYSFCSTDSIESPDRGIGIPTGLNITIRTEVYSGSCGSIRQFYACFFALRTRFSGKRSLPNDLPYSKAWSILEAHYNDENWYEAEGYYRVGSYKEIPVPSQDWQTGWIGGLMATLPQLSLGSSTTRERAMRNLEFAFSNLPARSGLFKGGWSKGKPWGDNFRDDSLPWVMIRKNADALYFLLKSIDLLEKQDPKGSVPAHWINAIENLADALVQIWQDNHQWGQFINYDTREITIGGSTSAGLVPGALALAYQYFNNPLYLEVAEAGAKALVQTSADKGYTTGGPGEILQCPDSESAFALLESLVTLYEVTLKPEWLDDAVFLAHHCASWCVSYDYPFPHESEFGRLDLKSRGSVWASVQNKHSAPGICTFSGDSLLKLFRATLDERYLDLIQEIAHNITQYLSRQDRRIRGFQITDVGNYDVIFDTPPGWMSERVQLSDFSEPTGEIFAGACWCEVSCMLTTCEIPGVYVLPDLGKAFAFDHVTATILPDTGNGCTLQLHNPTRYDIQVTLLSENADQRKSPLGLNALLSAPRVSLQPGEIHHIEL